MRALLAFDKFKDAVTAHEACRIAAAALRETHPDWEIDLCPLTDGGEGFAQILTESAQGELRTADVTGPRGAKVSAAFGWVPWKNIPASAQQRLALAGSLSADAMIAIIEMASASGLALLSARDRDPWVTSSIGTGEVMRHAASSGASALLLGIGGSATNDLGLGALSALGLEFAPTESETISPPIPRHWDRISLMRGAIPSDFPPVRVACDVTNPLLGPNGCASIYGPQKGLKPDDLPQMERSSKRIADQLCAHFGVPPAIMDTAGAGAAGGIAFGLMAAVRARLLSGFDLTSNWFGLAARIHSADLVLTGEGRFDESSAQGKGPGAILAMAANVGKPVHVFAGKIASTNASSGTFHSITPDGWKLEDALRATPDLLRRAIQQQFH